MKDGDERRVHVKFFAIFREMVGLKEDWVEGTEGLTVQMLWDRYVAAARNPGVAQVRAAFSVNQRLVAPETQLKGGDEVGFLPPVSGGEGIRPEPLELAELIRRVERPEAGAIVTFSGVVRNNSGGTPTRFLEYEAYPELAARTLQQIEEECRARWPETALAMAHRTGKLEIGEASVMIASAAPHRGQAFAACRYAIERIKATLPVWKKEFTSETDYWVEGPLAGETAESEADRVVRAADIEAEGEGTGPRGD